MWEQRVGYLAWEREDGVAVKSRKPRVTWKGTGTPVPPPSPGWLS